MKKWRIIGDGTKWIIQTKFLWFWTTEYELVDDIHSLVSPDLYGPLHVPKRFDAYLEAVAYVNKKYPRAREY